ALDGVTDPQNLGSVVRTASCAGATGVVVPRHRAAHVSPSAAKAAAGAIEYVPMAVVSGIPAALTRAADAGAWRGGVGHGGGGGGSAGTSGGSGRSTPSRSPPSRSSWCSAPRGGGSAGSPASAAISWSGFHRLVRFRQ